MNPTRISTKEWLLVLGGACAGAALFCLPLASQPDHWGISDWDQHLFFHAEPRRTILHHGQVPLWNPYNAGGLPDLGNPQSRILAPTFPLTLAFGAVRGVKLDIAVHCAIALASMWMLARTLGSSRTASALAAGVYGLGGLFVYPLVHGMTWHLAMAYAPLLFLGFWLSADGRRFAWLGGLAAALMLFSGGAYVLVIAVLTLGILAALLAMQRRGVAPLRSFAAIGLFGLGFAAVKLLPTLEFLRAHPRRMDDPSGYSLGGLAFSLFDRSQRTSWRSAYAEDRGFWSGIHYGLDENLMYIGWAAGILGLAGIAFAARRHWPLVAAMAIALWLSFGTRAPVSLWNAAHELPLFESMRVAQRFRIGVILCFACFAAFGFDALRARLAARAGARVATVCAALLASLVVADLLWVNGAAWSDAFPIRAMEGRRPGDFRQYRGVPNYDASGFLDGSRTGDPRTLSASGLLPAFLSNIGAIGANESALEGAPPAARYEQVAGVDDPNYRGEVYLDGVEGSASFDLWTPNRLVISVEAKGPGLLVVNQNYDAGWRAADGRPMERAIPSAFAGREGKGGAIGVRVTEADRRIELRYDPPSFRWGLAASLATALIAAAPALRGGRPRRGASPPPRSEGPPTPPPSAPEDARSRP